MPDGSILAAPRARAKATPAPGVTILAGHLREAVRIASLATMRRNTVPILSNLLLRFSGDTLTATGTDMEVANAATAPATGTLPDLTVNARALAALLARLEPETEISLQHDAGLGRMILSGGGLVAKLLTLPVEDFPNITEMEPAASFRLDVADLRRLLDTTAPAISTEETRYYLNGIYLQTMEVAGTWTLRAVATDGHCMIIAEMPCPDGAEGMPPVIIPRGAVSRLRTILAGKAAGCVGCQISDTKVRFHMSGWTLISKTIDGTYPEYMRVVPAAGKGRLLRVLSPRGFARALETVAGISWERSRPVTFTAGADSLLYLRSTSPDMGEATLGPPADVAAWDAGGPADLIGFQMRYLRDLCRALPSTGFTMQVIDGLEPCRIEFTGGLAVLMPMRV